MDEELNQEINYELVDHIITEEPDGTYTVIFRNLTDDHAASIQEWLKNNIEYNDLKEAPALPTDEYPQSDNHSYVTITHEADAAHNNETWTSREIKSFKEVAFTGEYDSLVNAPSIPSVGGNRPSTFHEIAFTGQVGIDNVSIGRTIDLTSVNLGNLSDFVGWTQSDLDEENNKLHDFGNQDMYVRGYNKSNYTLSNALNNAFNMLKNGSHIPSTIFNNTIPIFFKTNTGLFYVLDLDKFENAGEIQHYIVNIAPVYSINYNKRNYFNNDAGATAAEATSELNNITINNSKRQVWIFDNINHTIYCKVKNDLTIADIESISFSGNYEDLNNLPILNVQDTANCAISGLAEVARTGDYTDLINPPNLNVQDTTDCAISGLADVAITGSYTDLEDTPVLDASALNTSISGISQVGKTGRYEDTLERFGYINFGNFIYSRSGEEGNYTYTEFPVGDDRRNLGFCGTNTFLIEHIDECYSSTGANLRENLLALRTDFQKRKLCYIQSGDNIYLITNIGREKWINNGIDNEFYSMTIEFFITTNNYNNIIDNNNNIGLFNLLDSVGQTINPQTDILDQIITSTYITNIIIDFKHNIIYSKVQRIFPVTSANDSIQITQNGELLVNLSTKTNNKLELITTPQEEQGLYVN